MPSLTWRELNISTALTRSLGPPVCPINHRKPCHVYATLPEDGGNSVFITFHINPESCRDMDCNFVFRYEQVSNINEIDRGYKTAEVMLSEYSYPISESTSREIYHVLLSDLNLNSTYVFWITESSWDPKAVKVYSYKTFDPNNIKILSGGDIGNNKMAREMNEYTVRGLGADVILVGGDIAYDNNVPTCYQAWDYLLKRLPHHRYDKESESTRIIPLVFGAGNHDLGVNAYAQVSLPHSKSEPVFKHFFPQNTNNLKIPLVTQRKSYFSTSIGDEILLVSLDMGYEATMEGAQAEWLESVLKNSSHRLKIVQYHGPILTACHQDSTTDQIVIAKGKEFFLPLFDKYNVTVVFENHTHSFKRTKRLKGLKEDDKGTLYLGEGAWGVEKPSGICTPENEDITVKSTLDQNVWILEYNSGSKVKATAYGLQKKVLDEFDFDI